MTEKEYNNAVRDRPGDIMGKRRQGMESDDTTYVIREYTTRELKYIHDRYVREGGFVGLMSMSTPFPVQDYVYSLMGKHRYMNFFKDIKILLSRGKCKTLYKVYQHLYYAWRELINRKSERKYNKVDKEQERIRKEMRAAGCFAGSIEIAKTK
jgi:hypothetical protein